MSDHRCTRVAVLCALACLALAAGPAQAHRLGVFATGEGGRVSGYVWFSPGSTRARDVTVKLLDSGGRVLAATRTNDKGEFSFEAPAAGPLTIEARSAGHRATCKIGIEAPGGRSALHDRAASRPAPPRPHEHKDEVRLRDVLGGIGYIVGVLGILAYVKSRGRRRREKANE